MRPFIIRHILLFFFGVLAGCISPELRSARISIQEKDWERALSQLELERQRIAPSAEVYYLMGYCYENLNRLDLMSAYYDSSLALGDQFKSNIELSRRKLLGIYYKKASEYYQDTARLKEALIYLDSCLIIDPHQIDILINAAVWAYEGELIDRAKEYALKALKIETKPEITPREILMWLAYREKDYHKAAQYAQEIMEMVDPKVDTTETYLRAFDILIEYYAYQEDWAAAEKALNHILSLYPERIDIKLNLALTLLRRENFEGAKFIYHDILSQDPDNFDANLNLGTILTGEKLWLEAIPYLEKAHRIDPTNRIAIQNLMAAYYNSGQDQKGEEMRLKFEALSR